MDNRRNFYRILRVQPDVSHTVIQQSYRSLMQKLQLHPDLDGEQWDASIINQAYNVLRDAKKRAAYDLDLLSRYNVQTLSAGGMDGPKSSTGKRTHSDSVNSRNYYRVFHVQPDAELEVIKASYRALVKISNKSERNVLDEAYAVVGDATNRERYDRFLSERAHEEFIDELNEGISEVSHSGLTRIDSVELASVDGENHDTENRFITVIRRYCSFCKTPYTHSCPSNETKRNETKKA